MSDRGDPRADAEHYHLLAENATDIVYRAGADGKFEWVSPSIQRRLGWDPVALLGTRALDLVVAEDEPRVAAVRAAVYAGGEISEYECRFRTADGGFRWMSVHAHPVRSASGVIAGDIVGLTDIDREVRARHALDASEERYRLLAENSLDIILLGWLDQPEWISPAVTELLGHDPADLARRSMLPIVHPDDVAPLAVARERTTSGAVFTGQYRLRHRDGSWRWFETRVRPLPDGDGRFSGRALSAWRLIDDQVAASEALARSEQHYRLLADNASDVVYQSDADGLARWVAPSITRVLGWSPEELVGTSMALLVHPDDQAGAEEISRIAHASQAVEPLEVTLRARDRDGNYRWLSGYVTSLVDADGTFIGVVVSMRDVDDLVRAREAAEDERARTRATLDSLFDPHVVIEARRDRTGTVVDLVYVDANEAACTSLGRPREAVIGSLVSEVAGAAVVRDTAQLIGGVLDTGETLVLDGVPLPLPGDREDRRFDVRAVRNGEVVGVTWRDVTERHTAAKQVAESELRHRQLTEQLEDLLAHGSVLAIRARADGEIAWVSRSVGRLLGYDSTTSIGVRVRDWVHPNDLATLIRARESLSVDGTPMPLQLRLVNVDGNYRTFDGMAFRADDGGGRRELFQVTMADVTDRVQAGRLREQLMAVASHELRSPLAFISGSLRLFEAGVVVADSERGQEILRRVTATSERLARIADSLLRLQNLELTDIVMPSGTVELVKVVSEATLTVPLERGISVVCTVVPDGELWWRADADEVTQAVVNLAANAVKHSPDGVVVDVSLVPDADAVRIVVRDRGVGVVAEHRLAVFEAFHQLERSDRSGGVGLGLAIVAKIAERHAGRVWVEDPPEGTGACFVLELGHVPPPSDS